MASSKPVCEVCETDSDGGSSVIEPESDISPPVVREQTGLVLGLQLLLL